MARKVQSQSKPAAEAQADAVFAQLLITAMRIYGASGVRGGKMLKAR